MEILGYVKNKDTEVTRPFFDFDSNGYETQSSPFEERKWVSNKEWFNVTDEIKEPSYFTPQNE